MEPGKFPTTTTTTTATTTTTTTTIHAHFAWHHQLSRVRLDAASARRGSDTQDSSKGVQWKQGVVVYIIL